MLLMPTNDDSAGFLLKYLQSRYFDGVPKIPRTREQLFVFLREEGAYLLHSQADRMHSTSQTSTADRNLRMHLAGRAKAMRAVGDFLKATVVREEDITPPPQPDDGGELLDDDEDDYEYDRYGRPIRRRPRGPGRGGWPQS